MSGPKYEKGGKQKKFFPLEFESLRGVAGPNEASHRELDRMISNEPICLLSNGLTLELEKLAALSRLSHGFLEAQFSLFRHKSLYFFDNVFTRVTASAVGTRKNVVVFSIRRALNRYATSATKNVLDIATH
ncbi:MAG: hypothetical protein HUJ27_07190 [Rhodobacteraceae bacterium]|nr:hypothetical protein [Paracoccaceae bacterium]